MVICARLEKLSVLFPMVLSPLVLLEVLFWGSLFWEEILFGISCLFLFCGTLCEFSFGVVCKDTIQGLAHHVQAAHPQKVAVFGNN